MDTDMDTDVVLAWHFTTDDCRLRYGDGRVARVGETLTTDAEPVLCQCGLHASRRVVDALKYAPGLTLHRVMVGGRVVEGDDKLVGTSRRVEWSLAGIEVVTLVVEFARWCAERANGYAAVAADAADVAAYAAHAAAAAADAAAADAADAAAADVAAYAAHAADAADAAATAATAAAAAVAAAEAAEAARTAEREAQEAWWQDKLREAGFRG
jgi:hypothetical protein